MELRSLLEKKGFFFGVFSATIAVALPFVGLGFWKIFDLASLDAVVITLVVWLALTITGVVFSIQSYLKKADKELENEKEYENLKMLNKQMFSDILTLEDEITKLTKEIEELKK